jgi:uncharacterized integral membrane protein
MSSSDPVLTPAGTSAERQPVSGGADAPRAPERAEHHGPGVVKRTTRTVRNVLLIAIGALVALFAVVNSQEVEVRWIFGDPIQTPLILAIAVTFVAGVIIGWLVGKIGGRGSANKG